MALNELSSIPRTTRTIQKKVINVYEQIYQLVCLFAQRLLDILCIYSQVPKKGSPTKQRVGKIVKFNKGGLNKRGSEFETRL